MIRQIINKRKAFLFLFIIVIILGVRAYSNIPKEEYPDVTIPIIYISTYLEGISPSDSERLLIKPLENKLKTISNVDKINSYARENGATIILEFQAGFDQEKALKDVREKTDEAKANLPKNIDEPFIKEINLSQRPVLNLILTGTLEERSLINIARNLKNKIEGLPEILSVQIAGNLEDVVEIIIDPVQLENYKISFDIVQQIIDNNVLITAGEITSSNSRFSIRIPSLIKNTKDILTIPIKQYQNKIIKISDIATIKKNYKDRKSIARINGEDAITLEIAKRTGENVIETIKKVKSLLAKEKSNLPSNLAIIYGNDSSKRIMETNQDLQNNIILAILLVLITLLFTIGLRASFLVALTVPGSFFIAILILQYLGITLNVVVLFALILSVGLLVDASIVVVEYASTLLRKDISAKKAFAAAVIRMRTPIIISTITTLIVFLPLLFWPGLVGQFMKFIPLTLIITLSSSLLMALVFIPVLGSFLKPDKEANQYIFGKSFVRGYVKLIRFFLKKPFLVLSTVFFLLFIIIILFTSFGKGTEFFPKIEPNNATINIRARGNLSIYEKDNITKEIEKIILFYQDQIRIFYSRTGSGQNEGQEQAKDNIATIQLDFQDWQVREKAAVILANIREDLEDVAGIIIEIGQEKKGPSSGKDVQIELSSDNSQAMFLVAEKIVSYLKTRNDLNDIEDSRPVNAIEWRFEVDTELAKKAGVSLEDIGDFTKLVTVGAVASKYHPDDNEDEVDIVIRFPKKYRNLSQFDNLKIILKNGKAIPISNFVKKKAVPEISSIERVDGKRVVNIRASAKKNKVVSNIIIEIKEWLEKQKKNDQIEIKFLGDEKDQQESEDFLKNSFFLALMLMALLLVMQFNSFYKMIIIVTAIFFSIAGVLLGLLITGTTFGIVMCGVGVISLAGIVVNNNIIFIDSFLLLKNKFDNVEDAIVATAQRRLRPILLTAITTILGLIPMIFSVNINFFKAQIYFGAPSSQWWQQLATTIAGGLFFATILTLFLTPALLLIGERFFGEDIKT